MLAAYPLQVLLQTFSGIENRHQADVIAYLVEETPPARGTSERDLVTGLRRGAGRRRSTRDNRVTSARADIGTVFGCALKPWAHGDSDESKPTREGEK